MNLVDSNRRPGWGTPMGVLLRRLPIVLACLVVTPVLAYVIASSQPEEFQATAVLLFKDDAFDDQLLGEDVSGGRFDSDRTAATNTALVSLRVVAERTARQLDNGTTTADVRAQVETGPRGKSNLVEVTATASTPERAAALATTFAEQFVRFRRSSERRTISDAAQLVRRRISRLRRDGGSREELSELRGRLRDLRTLSAVQTGSVEMVESAEPPSSPSAPKPLRAVIVGLLLGGMLGVALAFLVDRLDRRLRDPEEARDELGRPILGSVPLSRAIGRQTGSFEQLGIRDVEAFRLLRANLRYFDVTRNAQVVLVTSAGAGDGKSTVAWNLAQAAAEAGSTVLLLEADLRRSGIARRYTLEPNPGLTGVLVGRVDMEDVIQTPEQGRDGRRDGGLRVLSAGPSPPNPADLLESERMADVLAQARDDYDLVVVDTPPLTVVSDAIPLLGRADGVLVVARMGSTVRGALAHLRQELERLDATVLGLVVNGVKAPTSDYYERAAAPPSGSAEPALARPAGELPTATPA